MKKLIRLIMSTKKILFWLGLKKDNSAIKPFQSQIKSEQNPTHTHIYHTEVPGGISMDKWLGGEWSKYNRETK